MAANYEPVTIGYDTTFELNEFHEPRIRSEIEVVMNTLLFVLFSKPGQYPSIPTIGLDIQSNLYEFYEDIDEEDLKAQIIEQCNMLGAYFLDGTITIKKANYKNKPSLLICVDGNAEYPDGYKHDDVGNSDRYLIGLTYDETNKMVSSIKEVNS